MGYWRKGQVNLEPGDTITADIRVPDPEKVMAMLQADPNQVMPVPEAPNAPLPTAPGRPRPGVAEPPEPIRPPGPGDVPPRPRPGGPGSNPSVYGGGEPQPIDPATMLIPRTVAEDALLLDVATTTVVSEQGIAKTKTENQAFLLNEQGLIVVRTPDGDRSAGAYQRLVRSAERGEEGDASSVVADDRGAGVDRCPDHPGPRKGDGGGERRGLSRSYKI